MKNFLKISLLATILLTSVATYANDDRGYSLAPTDANDKSIVFNLEADQKIEVTITANNGEVLYQKNIQGIKGSKRVYNLAAFPDGDYTFKLVTATEVAEYPVTIYNGKTVVDEPSFTKVFKPTLTKEQKIVTLSFENTVSEPVEVTILDENNEAVYSKTFDANSVNNKRFNLNGAEARELTFIVKSKNQEYVKVIDLR